MARSNLFSRRRLFVEALESRVTPVSTLAIADASLAEGDAGSANMNFTVTRSGDLGPAITVSYATADGTAHARSDYAATSGTLTIPVGATTGTISVPVAGNRLLQGDRALLAR